MPRLALLPVAAAALLGAGLTAPPARALPAPELAASIAGAGRVTAAELKGAQAAVDHALKTRKQRLESWQRAQNKRDAAAADVEKKKKAGVRGAALEDALKGALSLDEAAAHARSQLLASESAVSTQGAALLRLYDALLVERRRGVEALPAESSARAQAVTAYRALAAQRDAVRQALLPVLGNDIDVALPDGVDLEAHPDDDVETLLDKADLARDLEARFLRQAHAVRQRIRELEEEEAVAKDVSGMVGRSRLFDEEDRRLFVVHPEQTQTQSTSSGTTRSTTGNDARDPSATVGAGNGDFGDVPQDAQSPAPPESGGSTASPPPSAFASVTPPPAPVRAEQVTAPQTDPAIAGLLSSSTVSVDSLKALEKKLEAQAAALKGKSKALRSQAQSTR